MKITTTTEGFALNRALDAFVRNRLHVALKRLSLHVVAIDVIARNTGDPTGGADQQVTIRVRLPRRETVVIEAVHENLYAAIERGAKRTRRAVRCHVREALHLENPRLRDLPAVSRC